MRPRGLVEARRQRREARLAAAVLLLALLLAVFMLAWGLSGSPSLRRTAAGGRRTVPLPPRNFGAVRFSDVWLSLAYDDFGQNEPTPALASASSARALGVRPAGIEPATKCLEATAL